MTTWFTLLCGGACVVSALLIMRQQLPARQRLFALGLQIAIWVTVWSLYQPPKILPGPATGILHTPLATPAANHPTAPEAGQIPYPIGTLQSLSITGDGLTREALGSLPPVRLRPDRERSAPRWQLRWPHQLTLGDRLEVQISPQGAAPGQLTLSLLDPFGAQVDTAKLGPGPLRGGSVQLTDTPKLPGRWLYKLRIQQGGDQREEPVPVVVDRGATPRVLLWLSRASFETAALSRWLRQSGTEAQLITQLAPGVLRRVSINTQKKFPQQPLQSAPPFDLIILDSQLWPQLSDTQKQHLEDFTARKSVLWLVDRDAPDSFLDYMSNTGMSLHRDQPQDLAGALAAPDEIPTLTLTGLQPEEPRTSDLLLGSTAENPIYWGRSTPSGSVGLVLFENSYRWITAGFPAEFARLWTDIFRHQLAFAGKQPPVVIKSPLPKMEQRVTLCSPDFTAAPTVTAESDGDPLVAVSVQAEEPGHCFAYWPRGAGWHHLKGTESDFSFYVFAPGDWPWWQRDLAVSETAQMATAQLGAGSETNSDLIPIPRQWIAALLMALLLLSWWRERALLR
ncbi:hypothetical protein [Microbulbifer discodermiae]|uniref:hypothetical protein n=1 Tax=Microbulbifer sp. 2201CG32-9 TaxID=3232309 RepID=UPI00345B53DD